MTDQDEQNLVRFLQDLAGVTDGHGKGFDAADLADYQERVSARLRGDRLDPSPEATRGQKRTPEPAGKRGDTVSRVPRWPIRAWWHRD